MGQGFSASVETGKDGKATPRGVQPSKLFGLDTLGALLAEQIDAVEAPAPRDGPATIDAWLVREGLQEVAADELDMGPPAPPTPRAAPATIDAWLVSEGLQEVAADEVEAEPSTPAPRDGPATIEAWLVSEGLQDIAADDPVEDLPDLAASVASLAASVDPDRAAALKAWEEEAADPPPSPWRPAPVVDTAAARDEARRRLLLGTVDRLTAMPAVRKTNRSA